MLPLGEAGARVYRALCTIVATSCGSIMISNKMVQRSPVWGGWGWVGEIILMNYNEYLYGSLQFLTLSHVISFASPNNTVGSKGVLLSLSYR